MHAHLMSDVHLEFADVELVGGELLILAGDVLLAPVFSEERTDKTSQKLRYRFRRFIRDELSKYDRVLYVIGNHESYGGVLTEARDAIRRELPSHVTLLENDTVDIDGVTFFGATMWTDFLREDPQSMWVAKTTMNDYRVIRMPPDRRLEPSDTLAFHRESLAKLAEVADRSDASRLFVITHHAPTALSVDPRYKGSHRENGAYYSDLSEFILARPKIRNWVHGHMHLPVDYTVGECRVTSNPRGYLGHEEHAAVFDEKLRTVTIAIE